MCSTTFPNNLASCCIELAKQRAPLTGGPGMMMCCPVPQARPQSPCSPRSCSAPPPAAHSPTSPFLSRGARSHQGTHTYMGVDMAWFGSPKSLMDSCSAQAADAVVMWFQPYIHTRRVAMYTYVTCPVGMLLPSPGMLCTLRAMVQAWHSSSTRPPLSTQVMTVLCLMFPCTTCTCRRTASLSLPVMSAACSCAAPHTAIPMLGTCWQALE